ncbi:MAG: thioesterase family protein [Rhodobacteraceae bacterium]|nr:thioesterase family protein [Paracoccaceae bacterium]
MIYVYETIARPEWIDYNGHMQDAYYGLIFSYAVDSMQDEIGFDREYRERTHCTIYLLEDHKYYLREVHEGDRLRIETRVLDVDEKRIHLLLDMKRSGQTVALCEFVELHVKQQPRPHATPMPADIRTRLETAKHEQSNTISSFKRARSMSLQPSGIMPETG